MADYGLNANPPWILNLSQRLVTPLLCLTGLAFVGFVAESLLFRAGSDSRMGSRARRVAFLKWIAPLRGPFRNQLSFGL
jgi:hypothetical protein